MSIKYYYLIETCSKTLCAYRTITNGKNYYFVNVNNLLTYSRNINKGWTVFREEIILLNIKDGYKYNTLVNYRKNL